MLPLSCWRSKSGVRMSGTRSRKYPVFGLPFTRTPTSRSRSTQRQTVERETPISLATRSPLIAIVALFAKSVSSEVSRRSVVPGREVGAMEAGRSLLVLDGVHKQAEICRGSRVRQGSRGKKICSGLRVLANVVDSNASGNLHHAVDSQLPRNSNAVLCLFGGHVVEQHRLRSGRNRFAQFALVADLNLYRQHGVRCPRGHGLFVSRQRDWLGVHRRISVSLIQRLLHAASQHDVIFLQQNRIIKPDTVIRASAGFYCIFFQQ